jgi:hypothetical protein
MSLGSPRFPLLYAIRRGPHSTAISNAVRGDEDCPKGQAEATRVRPAATVADPALLGVPETWDRFGASTFLSASGRQERAPRCVTDALSIYLSLVLESTGRFVGAPRKRCEMATLSDLLRAQVFRQHGSNRSGGSFTPATVEFVWRMATPVYGFDAAEWRQDAAKAWIRRSDYGVLSNTGWEIDHICPVALHGGDDLSNLQALQWSNNREKGDQFPFIGPWPVTARRT